MLWVIRCDGTAGNGATMGRDDLTPPDGPYAELFLQLADLIEAESEEGRPVYFKTTIAIGSEVAKVGGTIFEEDRIFVDLYRRDGAHVPGDGIDECITLAHELGHVRSITEGHVTLEQWRDFRDVDALEHPTSASAETRADYLAEEERAWAVAHSVLRDLGFEDCETFNEIRRRELEDYRCGLFGSHDAS